MCINISNNIIKKIIHMTEHEIFISSNLSKINVEKYYNFRPLYYVFYYSSHIHREMDSEYIKE